MAKLDFKKQDKALYSGEVGQWQTIEVPRMCFLMVDGRGDPNGPAYAAALSAIYPLAYTIKFAAKADDADFVVPPLEALWWADDPTAFVRGERSEWQWTAMIRMPALVSPEKLAAAKDSYQAKQGKRKQPDEAPIDSVRLEDLNEGTCLQTLHIGPYKDEAAILAELHERVMPEMGLTFNGPHHEVYLSDPRRVPPEKLKTVLRQPVCAIAP